MRQNAEECRSLEACRVLVSNVGARGGVDHGIMTSCPACRAALVIQAPVYDGQDRAI